ncbi:MAG: SDR family oxidoreductase [Chloroflexi bacterium]|nr:SDR family oxidoreductase [Chloroflexota bacterium]
MRFQDKVAIVTGSGRGIGRECALGIARQGGKVVVFDLDPDVAEQTAADCKAAGGGAVSVAGSVSDRDAWKNAIDETHNAFGTIDILINNAGVIAPAMIVKMTDEQWNTVVDIHMKGTFYGMQAVAPTMIQRYQRNPNLKSCGKIVNITSVAGIRGTIGQINYGAAKAGIIGMTMSAAREWGRYRINVNCIGFGTVETRMTEVIRTDPRFAERTRSQIAMGYIAEPSDVAPAVLFLAHEDANYVTGHTINCSGGSHIGF